MKLKPNCLTVIIGFVVFLSLSSFVLAPFAYSQTVRQVMDKIVNDTVKEKNIPGAIVAVWSPSVGVWVKTVGESDIGSGQSMHDKKKVRIGSVSQTFLSSLLLLLVDDKKINLDDPVKKYLPFVPNGENITVKQLANNTSGIFDYMEDESFLPQVYKKPLTEYQPIELVNIAFKHEPYFAPGKGWHLSNTNFILLGMIMEQVTLEKIDDLIRLRVINKIGLRNTSFAVSPFMEGDYSRGYTEKQKSNIPQDITLLDPSCMWAAGAIVSDTEDLALWVKAFYKGSYITDKMRQARFNWIETGQPDLKYGLGIKKLGEFIGYDGGIPGYSCVVYYFPAKETTIIVILNKYPDDGAAMSLFKSISTTILPDDVSWR